MRELFASLIALVGVVGCALKAPSHGPAKLCGGPERVIVAELEGDESLKRDATDALAAGLAELGFQVLAPRRELPPARNPPPLDWIFGGNVSAKAGGGLEVRVELRSLRENRRIWAIVDALPDDVSGEAGEVLRRTIETALSKFELDVLSCRVSAESA